MAAACDSPKRLVRMSRFCRQALKDAAKTDICAAELGETVRETEPMRILVAAAAALFVAQGAFGGAGAAEPRSEAARFTYAGYMGGLKIGWARVDAALTDDRYAAKLKLQTGGLVGWFVEWRHGSAAYGATGAGGDAPLAVDAYRNDSFWKGKDRFVKVAYPDGVAAIAEAAPHPVEDESRPAIDPGLLKGVLDPLSAIVAIGQVIEKTGACETEFGVFDGRRRYQLKVTDMGERALSRSRYAPFAGLSRRCDFVFERVAGFKKKSSVDDSPTAGRAYYRSTTERAPLMPVRVEADSGYGAAILHLKEVELLNPQLTERAGRTLDRPTHE